MPEPTLPLSPRTLALLQRHLAKVVGPIEFAETLAEVASESRSEEWRDPSAHGLYIFGRAASGDAWAVDTKEGDRIVVLSHDLLWEEEVANPREAMCVVAESLSDALEEARSNTLPVDYFTASEGEAFEEPDAKLTFAPGGLDAGLALPLADRPAVLAAFFGPDTAVTWDQLEEAFFELEATERAVLAARYGLFGGKPAPVETAAKTLGMTSEAVKEEEARGVRWLKRIVARPKTS